MQTHVDVKKLSPPSFYNVPMMTEGLPSLPRESMVLFFDVCRLYYFCGAVLFFRSFAVSLNLNLPGAHECEANTDLP